MKHLFELNKDGSVSFAPQILMIKEFNKLWKSTKDKSLANHILASVYYYADVRSSYRSFNDDQRWIEIGSDVMYDYPKWKPDQLVFDCISKYEELSRPVSADSLESAKSAQKKINDFISIIDLNEKDDYGKLVHNPKQLQMMINDMPKTAKSILDLQRLVEQEISEETMLRAGREKGFFEEDDQNPDN